MSLSTGTTLGSTLMLVPSSFMSSSDSLLRASVCLCCKMEVSRKYNLYESPIQRNRDVMKAGLMPASSKSTRAQTRPECDDIRLNSSLDQSEWTLFAIDRSTSAILPPVRYFLMPNLLTKMPIGSESDWPRLLARK